MELHLRLALPTLLIPNKCSLLDLNSSSSHSHDVEEQSDTSTGCHGSSISTHRSLNKNHISDDSFEPDTASTDTFPQTLPLLLWNKYPDCPNLTLSRNEEEAVGWPPVKSCLKKHCSGGGGGGLYVKAQMEGVVIIRKIDLSPHQSYDTLVSTLLFMFGRGQESGDGYTLTYQDMEGDWILAADVPWRIFIESVQRLKLVRNGG